MMLRRKLLFHVALGLICIPFIALVGEVPTMLTVHSTPVQTGGGLVEVHFLVYREAAFARLGISVIGLLLVFIPLRKQQLWGWFALLLLTLAYFLPVFAIPYLIPFRGLWMFSEAIAQSGSARGIALDLLFTGLLVMGLIASLPSLLRKSNSGIRTPERQKP